jgi:hypothetical protein
MSFGSVLFIASLAFLVFIVGDPISAFVFVMLYHAFKFFGGGPYWGSPFYMPHSWVWILFGAMLWLSLFLNK